MIDLCKCVQLAASDGCKHTRWQFPYSNYHQPVGNSHILIYIYIRSHFTKALLEKLELICIFVIIFMTFYYMHDCVGTAIPFAGCCLSHFKIKFKYFEFEFRFSLTFKYFSIVLL